MRFIADNTVGRLRRWMSLLGYDVVYDPRPARAIVRDPATAEGNWIVVGRCPSLAEEDWTRGRFFAIKSSELGEQLAAVARAYPLDFSRTAFTRCEYCNAPLIGPLSREAVLGRLPPRVREWRDDFRECPQCRRVYWEGTHTERIRAFLRGRVGVNL